jgi:hypothetical protein
MRAALIAAILSLLVANAATAQVAVTAQVARDELNQAIAQLERSVGRLGAAAPARLVESVRWLRGHAAGTDLARLSRPYLQALTYAAAALDADPTRLMIEDIADELEAKVDHCEELSIGMGGSVALRVNTRRGSDTVNNWQVFSLLKIYERAAGVSAPAFATLSAPAETQLEPGRYWIWARDPVTGRTSERTLFKIAGKQEFSLDLPVP